MKKINVFNKFTLLGLGLISLASCDDYLDKMPDNRAEIDSESKIQSLLVSAYPTHDYMLVTELMSDNVDMNGADNPNTDRFADQVYAWQDVTESDNEDPNSIWEDAYSCIATANQSLQAIDELGGATTTSLKEAKAEALLCRAYNEFILTNVFCMNYNATTSSKDFGIPYMEAPETSLSPKYERGTVAEDYEKIEKDILEALPMVGDSYYTVPKYHFNAKAAYAFAARFYLYYQKWDKVIEYATKCLGTQPKTMLRDWVATAALTQSYDAVSQHYIDATLNCNLMLATSYSKMGLVFGPYRVYSKYAHERYLSTSEDAGAENIWGTSGYYEPVKNYAATNLNKSIFWKSVYLFETTDAVAKIGYYHSVYPVFTADECLLSRAEAYVMLKQYDKACDDLNSWLHNRVNTSFNVTPENVVKFYNSVEYATGLFSTVKKHLNPSFTIDAEGSEQECMLQCVLGFRRIETLQDGLRWFDIKRYGIKIYRRTLNSSGIPAELTDSLSKDDPRRAIQIPMKVRQAGFTPNPR